MQKIKYPLVISDFDGTLVCADGNITQENKDAISAYVNDGGIFAISTGRMHYGILSRAKELGLKGVVSCCQGALIVDIDSGKPLLNGTFSNEMTVKICRAMEKLNLHIHLYAFEDYYVNMDDDALRFYQTIVRRKAHLVLDMPLSQYALENHLCAYKLLAMVHPEDNARIMKALQEENFEGCIVTKSDEVLVEVVNANYSKGTAVQFLADYYHIPVEKTIGIGDQWNDVPMIQAAGLGIAVKNADPKLKEYAVELNYSNEESAVGKAILQYAYEQEK